MRIIGFKRMSLLQRFWLKVSPRARAKYHAQLRGAMRYLIKHPEAPCMIEGEVIPGAIPGASSQNN